MIGKVLTRRYADAYLGFVKETSSLNTAQDDFKNIKDIIRDNPELMVFLQNPEIPYNEKSELIDRLFTDAFPKEFRQFLKLLLEKGRINKLLDIAEYVRTAYGSETEALLKTSFPLDLEVVKSIQDSLEKKFNKKFKFYISLDGSLLGGVQVIIGNTVLDGSVRRRLDEMRGALEKIRIS